MTLVEHPHHTHDKAKRSRDPTGTAGIRARFRAAANARLGKLSTLVRMGMVDRDMLALGMAPHVVPKVERGTQLKVFTEWFYSQATAQLYGDGSWVTPFTLAAYKSGVEAAARLTLSAPVDDMDHIYGEKAKNEFSGIVDRMTQRAAREAAGYIVAEASPRMAWHAVCAVIWGEQPKLYGMCNTIVVEAHNGGRLDQFKAAGVRQVGVEPEALWTPPVRDARKPKLARRGGRLGQLRGISRAKSERVNVETAGDDLVCEVCEDLAAGGPYDLDDARDLFPAHVNCRCALVPEGDLRFAGNR